MPILTLASPLLVFVLVQAFSSWSAAGRSIIDQEWPAMADQELSNVPTYWS